MTHTSKPKDKTLSGLERDIEKAGLRDFIVKKVSSNVGKGFVIAHSGIFSPKYFSDLGYRVTLGEGIEFSVFITAYEAVLPSNKEKVS